MKIFTKKTNRYANRARFLCGRLAAGAKKNALHVRLLTALFLPHGTAERKTKAFPPKAAFGAFARNPQRGRRRQKFSK
ncbi:MAG: hypothetical protein DBX55_04130 [Verrucomicrobia bacterium]|nr:MAG: hypothetical protein DBX55_04130 [Verrucomicrobiota bacterium]